MPTQVMKAGLYETFGNKLDFSLIYYLVRNVFVEENVGSKAQVSRNIRPVASHCGYATVLTHAPGAHTNTFSFINIMLHVGCASCPESARQESAKCWCIHSLKIAKFPTRTPPPLPKRERRWLREGQQCSYRTTSHVYKCINFERQQDCVSFIDCSPRHSVDRCSPVRTSS